MNSQLPFLSFSPNNLWFTFYPSKFACSGHFIHMESGRICLLRLSSFTQPNIFRLQPVCVFHSFLLPNNLHRMPGLRGFIHSSVDGRPSAPSLPLPRTSTDTFLWGHVFLPLGYVLRGRIPGSSSSDDCSAGLAWLPYCVSAVTGRKVNRAIVFPHPRLIVHMPTLLLSLFARALVLREHLHTPGRPNERSSEPERSAKDHVSHLVCKQD